MCKQGVSGWIIVAFEKIVDVKKAVNDGKDSPCESNGTDDPVDGPEQPTHLQMDLHDLVS